MTPSPRLHVWCVMSQRPMTASVGPHQGRNLPCFSVAWNGHGAKWGTAGRNKTRFRTAPQGDPWESSVGRTVVAMDFTENSELLLEWSLLQLNLYSKCFFPTSAWPSTSRTEGPLCWVEFPATCSLCLPALTHCNVQLLRRDTAPTSATQRQEKKTQPVLNKWHHSFCLLVSLMPQDVSWWMGDYLTQNSG